MGLQIILIQHLEKSSSLQIIHNRYKYESDERNKQLDMLNKTSFLSSEENSELKSGIADS